jgi:hypothetical protein
MYHQIEFRMKGLAEVERPGHVHLERLVITAGTRLRARIAPRVIETRQGPVEVADLHLEDGSVARGVRFASFNFLDS